MKKFYRVCKPDNQQGLWYRPDGEFAGLIHTEFNFCMNSTLEMEFDPELVGWLSATETLEDLYKWFSKQDIERLSEHGWQVCEYEATDFWFYERFQHYVINQKTSKLIKILEHESIAID